MGSNVGAGNFTLLCSALVALLFLGQARADCFYEYNGGCVVLSLPPVVGTCLSYYSTIIPNIGPSEGACYDGFYSDCVCAVFAPSTSCISFADFATSVDPPIGPCPSFWSGIGTGIVTLQGDNQCATPDVTFVSGPTDPFVYGCDNIIAPAPGYQCCSTLCDQTC